MLFWKTAQQSISRNPVTKTMARLLVFDFDGTVTKQDTINILAQLPIYSSSLPQHRTEFRDKWKNIVDLYVADHAKHNESYVPKVQDRRTLAEELAYLESLRAVEEASAKRVASTGFFAGSSREQWICHGRRARLNGEDPYFRGDRDYTITVRKGFSEFVRQAKDRGDKLGIVSVNWSKAFIEGVIQPEDENFMGEKDFVKMVGEIGYPDGELKGPKEMGGMVLMTANDKLEGLETLLELDEAKGGSEKCSGTVYFGDSVTDLECLMKADTGIVMVNEGEEESSKLMCTLLRLGFKVPHVSECEEDAKLAWARDFYEVSGSKIWVEDSD